MYTSGLSEEFGCPSSTIAELGSSCSTCARQGTFFSVWRRPRCPLSSSEPTVADATDSGGAAADIGIPMKPRSASHNVSNSDVIDASIRPPRAAVNAVHSASINAPRSINRLPLVKVAPKFLPPVNVTEQLIASNKECVEQLIRRKCLVSLCH
jgi:hypothetical protein